MSLLVWLTTVSLYSVYLSRTLSMSELAYWYSLLLLVKMIRAISQSHNTDSSYAFFIRPNLRFVNVTCTMWNVASKPSTFRFTTVVRATNFGLTQTTQGFIVLLWIYSCQRAPKNWPSTFLNPRLWGAIHHHHHLCMHKGCTSFKTHAQLRSLPFVRVEVLEVYNLHNVTLCILSACISPAIPIT